MTRPATWELSKGLVTRPITSPRSELSTKLSLIHWASPGVVSFWATVLGVWKAPEESAKGCTPGVTASWSTTLKYWRGTFRCRDSRSTLLPWELMYRSRSRVSPELADMEPGLSSTL